MEVLRNLPSSLPEAFDPGFALKVVGVAREHPSPITSVPEYTTPGGPNSYVRTEVDFWTAGFFPGSIWALLERKRMFKDSVPFEEAELASLARECGAPLTPFAYPAQDHDQGFRFMPSFGREHALFPSATSREVVLLAAKGLAERFDSKVGCIRSWTSCKTVWKDCTAENQDEHFLVIVDNMMNLDLLFTASLWTGDSHYREVAEAHARTSSKHHIRANGGTYHVVNFDPKTGQVERKFAQQGYEAESTWSRGQAWAIYGFADCALFTGDPTFTATARRVADRFLELLTQDGVPYWDFDCPRPTPRDASAACVAACGLLKLFRLLRASDPSTAEKYLSRAFKLIKDTIAMCVTPAASVKDGSIDFGEGGWETILKHSTINGNERAQRLLMDHGLSYADYYLLEFGNESLKLQDDVASGRL